MTYFTWLQLPINDLRPLMRVNHRLPRPYWPDPRVAEDFVRSVGMVKERPRGGIDNWAGEHAYVSGGRLVRLNQVFNTKTGCRGTLAYTRIFGTDLTYRVDFGFRIVCEKRVNADRDLMVTLLSQPCQVGAREATLGQGGALVAETIARSTAAQGLDHSQATRWVTAAKPLIVTEERLPELDRPAITVESLMHAHHRVLLYRILTPGTMRSLEIRQFRGSIWRLHAELELLREVMRSWSRAPDEFDTVRLSEYLAESTAKLVRTRRNGVDQPPLIALADGLANFDRTEMYKMADELRPRYAGIARRLDLILERSQRAVDHPDELRPNITILGDILMSGDKFTFNGPASGVFGSEAKVDNSEFNQYTVQPQDWAELRQAVSDVISELPESEADELKQFAEELEKAPEHEKPSRLQRLADKAAALGAAALPVVEIANRILTALGVS